MGLKRRSLGLDISTISTGWAILEQNSPSNFTLIDYGRLDFDKNKPHKIRLVIFGELISQIISQSSNVFDYVVIEDTFVRFDPSVTKKLSRFAGVAISSITCKQPDVTIMLVPPQSIKSAIFPRQKKEKEDIKIEMITRYNLVDVRNREQVKNFCNDVTDAIAIAHFPFFRKVEEKWIV